MLAELDESEPPMSVLLDMIRWEWNTVWAVGLDGMPSF